MPASFSVPQIDSIYPLLALDSRDGDGLSCDSFGSDDQRESSQEDLDCFERDLSVENGFQLSNFVTSVRVHMMWIFFLFCPASTRLKLIMLLSVYRILHLRKNECDWFLVNIRDNKNVQKA